ALTLCDPATLLSMLDPVLVEYGLETLVRLATLTLGVGMLGFALLLVGRHNRLALGVGVATAAVLLLFVQTAHEPVEPLFSWRPFVHYIHEAAPTESRVFFRAEDEYQLCGGLNYYLGQRVDLLAPPGWVPPTFLAGRADRLFTPRVEFEQEWPHDAVFFVSDEVDQPRDQASLV